MQGQQRQSKTQAASSWGFLTNHAHVLLCVARDPRSRARDIAEQVGITERAAQRILADLIADGYVTRTKVGRRNHYEIDRDGELRHPLLRELSIGPLIEVLDPDGQPKPRRLRVQAADPDGEAALAHERRQGLGRTGRSS